jgi:hypothetical protein
MNYRFGSIAAVTERRSMFGNWIRCQKSNAQRLYARVRRTAPSYPPKRRLEVAK